MNPYDACETAFKNMYEIVERIEVVGASIGEE